MKTNIRYPTSGTDDLLMTEQNQPAAMTSTESVLDDHMQTLLTEAKTTLGAAAGGYPMIAIDQPIYQVDSSTVVWVAQKGVGEQSTASGSHIIGECKLVTLNDEGDGAAMLYSLEATRLFFGDQYAKEIDPTDLIKATVSVIRQPHHGEVALYDSLGMREASYYPEHGYTGNDSLILKVTGANYSLEIHYFFRVMERQGKVSGQEIFENPDCKSEQWTISATFPQQPYTPGSDALTNYFLKDVNVTLHVANLSNGEVGETTGHSITLDDDDAGHGWFIDSTPQDNDEFLPTSNPNEWVAKAGSEAAGKMDLLTMLLHEYGHALGLDHDESTHQLMSEELQPGVRRTVSDEDMAKLWSLLSEPLLANGGSTLAPILSRGAGEGSDPSAPFNPLPLSLSFMFGFARRRIDTSPAAQGIVLPQLSSNDPNAVTVTPKVTVNDAPQFELATHTDVFNGGFSIADSSNAQYGWNTRGSVSLSNGVAELTENDRALSDLSQAFVLPTDVRALRFTIDAAQFVSNGSTPPDAFEVALLDSVTGLPIAGTISLTHSDALFNLQSNDTLTTASGVTVTGLPSSGGSLLSTSNPITVTIDLSQVAAGRSVKLYFDLLGLGEKGSRVVIDDVKLLTSTNTAPVAVGDTVTTANATPVRISVLANDTDAEGDPLTPVLVTAATNGIVVFNTDGTFTYTPNAGFSGTDQFTYRVGDGVAQSNVATVTIAVSAVTANHAPTAANDVATTAEDTAVRIDVLSNDTDADGDPLTAAVVSGPTRCRHPQCRRQLQLHAHCEFLRHGPIHISGHGWPRAVECGDCHALRSGDERCTDRGQ